MKKIPYSKTDEILKELSFFFSSLIFLLFFTTYLVAQEFSHQEIISEGRSVIINGDEISAKKRALDDALYFASLQAGAKLMDTLQLILIQHFRKICLSGPHLQ